MSHTDEIKRRLEKVEKLAKDIDLDLDKAEIEQEHHISVIKNLLVAVSELTITVQLLEIEVSDLRQAKTDVNYAA